jgi:YVTN family beta-propeller protein
MRRLLSSIAVAAVCLAPLHLAMSATAEVTPAYHVTKTVMLGAPERWDYVVFDPSTHDVFVSHDDRVSVVDGRTGAIVGTVEGMPGGTHGFGISAATGKGYTQDRGARVAVAFDLKTLKAVKRIPVDEDADSIAFDPASGHVFVIDGDPSKVTVIDPKTDSAIATINVGIGKLEYAVAGGNGKLYVNGAEKKEIVRIDTKRNNVDAHWPVPNCTSPHGMAFDSSTHRLFTSCTNRILVVIDTDNGSEIAAVPIGRGTDAVAFDPKRKLIFSSNGLDGNLSIIQEKDAKTFVDLGTVRTAVSARTMAIDPDTGRIFLAAAELDPSAPPPTTGRDMKVIPGSFRLLFLDPPG